MAVDHYENFPVASLLLPSALREPVAAIYGFARSADDFSDEGNLPPARRLSLLDGYRRELDIIEAGRPTDHPVFRRLAPVICAHDLPLGLFRDLLDAFTQDVTKDRYADYAELLDYCRRSADPVGRLLLRLFRQDSPANLGRSDAICSALQLINHWQDVAVDLKKNQRGRIYLPQEDLCRFGVGEDSLHAGRVDDNFRALMAFQVGRARALMLCGASLGEDLPGRIGLEIRAIIAGGLRILHKIEAVEYDVFRRRPQLTLRDAPALAWRTLFPRTAP
ncbi:squalene synthase HpnC [Denitratisoma oestradiolicum]|uniref:Squalene synthase HpnC n=1 Tax=Denitratisoma oestradiolicum TaxID=311182 RepID=A0A6S6XR42_9PROT|nr:squalene synthase HpnC [Denitratisoma oestradiolicum]TWO81284.1 squalene synthase HpnC [Denitratisoma oestradiolicum]CAB1368466.1 Squalene synthase HpnC [Denitratisoma oestradiolicum]